MLNIFFNPYPGMSADYESGKKCLLSTANACREIADRMSLKAYEHSGDDSVKCFIVCKDRRGVWFTSSSFLRDYSGRDRELVKWFLRLFDRGSRVTDDDLSICEDWVLRGFDVSAPVLEFALRQDGMAVTISDDADWKSDFYYFVEQPHELPNIHGQDDCSPLRKWIEQWSQRNLSFKSLLENNFNILFCKGASNTCFPSRHEEENVIKALKQARDYGYEIDNDSVKPFKSKYGNIRELRSYQDGVRIFFALRENMPVIGGFYRKSAAISQNKAGEYAAKRLKDQDCL
ncbi:MAG: hypothetical protein DRI57_06570 [Deltaproteobacteria bacterium]|nr:MAG: hypothetical protein DRI57_06570 [Deltaproteobacteria bacterium]